MLEKIQIGFREVEDPYDGEPLVVAVNTNTDLVEKLYHLGEGRGGINYAQFLAGRHFLHLVENAEGSRNLVVDPAREPVDCSGSSQAISLNRLDAARCLAELSVYLGRRDYGLARRLIAGDVTAYADPVGTWEERYQRRRLKDILEDLALFWGYASKKT